MPKDQAIPPCSGFLPGPRADASKLLPPTPVLREQLALAMRDVTVLRSLLRLAERTEETSRQILTQDAHGQGSSRG